MDHGSKKPTPPRVLVEQKIGDTFVCMLLEEFELNQDFPYRSLVFSTSRGVLDTRFATKIEAAQHQWKWISFEVQSRVTSRWMGRETGETILDQAAMALGREASLPVGDIQS